MSSKFDVFLGNFRIAKKQGDKAICYCPTHDDKHGSLHFTLDRDKILGYCFAGCQIADILAAVNLKLSDLFPTDRHSPEAIYQYRAKDGGLAYEKVKYRATNGDKTFKQRRLDAEGKIIYDLKDIQRIPYNYPGVIIAIKNGETIIWPEGEKDAETARILGYAYTTMGGASEWKDEWKSYFRNGSIVLFSDKDKPGISLVQNTSKSLTEVCKSVKVVILPQGKDLTEWVTLGRGRAETDKLITEAPELVKSTMTQIQLYNREQYLKVLSQWLYIEDQQAIDIIMATAICICLPGDPIWVFVITASGGMKTELLRTFSNERTYSISTLTPQTLISGLKGGKDIDLMPKLDGKLLVIKDFTSILSKKSEDQAGIFADLREAYDGYLEKSFGSGAGTKRYKSSFGILAGVTGAIDMYRVVHALLGERFLHCRLRTNPQEAIERASSLAGREGEMRTALAEATNSCMAYYAAKVSQCESIIVEQDTYQKIKALADLTAKLRSEVARDRFHKVLYQPQPEVGTRLAKQFRKLAQGLSIFYEDECIGEAEYNVLLRVAQDTVPKQRMKLVLGMIGEESLTTKAAGDRAEIPTDTSKEILEDLWMLNLVNRTGDSTFYWQLTDSMNYLLLDSGLGTQNTLRTHEKNNNSLG